MKILVACEFSGIVRDAFIRKGHDAWSCDFLPSEKPGNHIQGDVIPILEEQWDILIAHPPCTYLSYAANHCWNAPGREEKRQEAMKFFMDLYNAPIEKVCIENPVGLPCKEFRKADQIIHPYYFGESAMKRTCLWLRGLNKLVFTFKDNLFGAASAVPPPDPIYSTDRGNGIIKKRHWTEANHGGHSRSKTFQSFANAMAEQWG